MSIKDRVYVLDKFNMNYRQIQDFLIFKYGIHLELNRIGNICTDHKPTIAVNKYLNGQWRVPNYLRTFAKSRGFTLIVPLSNTKTKSKRSSNKVNVKKYVPEKNVKIYQPTQKLKENSASEFLRIVKEESIRIGSREAHLVYQNVKIRIFGND